MINRDLEKKRLEKQRLKEFFMATKHVWSNLNKGNNGGSDKSYKLKAEKKNRFRPLEIGKKR